MSRFPKPFLPAAFVTVFAARGAVAQEPAQAWEPIIPFSSTEILVGLIVAGSFLFFLIVFWTIMRHVRRSREFAHAERMKAIEVGQPLVAPELDRSRERYVHNTFWIAFWLGAAVPISALGAASSTTVQGHVHDIGLLLAIWICVALVGVASVTCATVLMVSSRRAIEAGAKTNMPRTAEGVSH